MDKKPKTWKKRGIVKQILKDHFHGFWQLHAGLFPDVLMVVGKYCEPNILSTNLATSRVLKPSFYM
jgi:hypothetical protein